MPLQSQRDEFTGEELYTLRSEQYFLPKLELEDEELAALQTAFYLLEGKFAYAEPLRLALQNLALGRPGFAETPTETAGRVEVLDPDYSPETPGRLAKLENAISKQRTVKFEYWSISTRQDEGAHAQPVRAPQRQRALVRRRARSRPEGHPHVPRLAHPRRDQVRDAARARLPHAERLRRRAVPRPAAVADRRHRRRRRGSRCRGDTAWWVQRAYGTTGTLEDGVFVTEYSSIPQLASWVLRQNGRAVPLEPHELKPEVGSALRRVRDGPRGSAPAPAREKPVRAVDGIAERPAGPVAPERFAVLQALLAYLLAACGEERAAEIPASELLERFPSVPADELEEHLSLLNLVNFGGGCYTVYAELQGSTVHVDKELWGDTFRAAPRLTPLEARAIRLALEYVGPMIAAEAHSPLARVRKKLEETFGQFDLERTPEPLGGGEEVDLVETLARGVREQRLVEIEYQKEADTAPTTRLVEPYSFGRELPNWYVHTWDRTSDGERSFRLDRMRSATLTDERFEPRAGFEPTKLRNARTAQILYAKDVARFAAERGARRLTDGTALARAPVRRRRVARERDPREPRRRGARRAGGAPRADRGAGEGARERIRRRAAPRAGLTLAVVLPIMAL